MLYFNLCPLIFHFLFQCTLPCLLCMLSYFHFCFLWKIFILDHWQMLLWEHYIVIGFLIWEIGIFIRDEDLMLKLLTFIFPIVKSLKTFDFTFTFWLSLIFVFTPHQMGWVVMPGSFNEIHWRECEATAVPRKERRNRQESKAITHLTDYTKKL